MVHNILVNFPAFSGTVLQKRPPSCSSTRQSCPKYLLTMKHILMCMQRGLVYAMELNGCAICGLAFILCMGKCVHRPKAFIGIQQNNGVSHKFGRYVVVTMTLSLTDVKMCVSAQCQEEGLEISGSQSYLLSSYPLVLQLFLIGYESRGASHKRATVAPPLSSIEYLEHLVLIVLSFFNVCHSYI